MLYMHVYSMPYVHVCWHILVYMKVDQEVKVHSEQQRVRDNMPYPDPRVALEPPEWVCDVI